MEAVSRENKMQENSPIFDREKPHLCIGTIGHFDHGKTTLTAAITRILEKKNLARFVPFKEIDKTPEEKEKGLSINLCHD